MTPPARPKGTALAALFVAAMGLACFPAYAGEQTARALPDRERGIAESPRIAIDGSPLPYGRWFKTALPDARLEIALPADHRAAVDGTPLRGAGATQRWTAPAAPGIHRLSISDPAGVTIQTVSLFVLEPSTNMRRGQLNGFRIGAYPPADAPPGFIRLNAGDIDTPVAPGFRIGQFLCKQQPDHWPKYLLLTEGLVERLQTLLDALRRDGATDADTLFVMSGYRSPFYNNAIAGSRRSRHLWGDAADVYVDVRPRDGVMDDLNGDRRITKADADWLYDYAERRFRTATIARGGLGAYKATSAHGPFVHIDGRGIEARWGR